MGLDNNKLALIILLFVAFSVFGNLFVWLKVTGNLAIGRASSGYVGICIDMPPTLESISNQDATTGTNFTYQVNATDSTNPIYYYGTPTPIAPTTTSLTSFFINRTSGLINFTSAESETGDYSVYIWVSHQLCNNNSNDSTTFTLSVSLSNKPPYWINYTRNLNLTEDVLFTLNLSTYVTEPENQTFNLTHNSTYQSFPSFNMTLIGLVNFTANDSDVGLHRINITVRDVMNAANSSIFNFIVINVNDAPIMQGIPDMQACEDAVFSYQTDASDEDLLIPPAYRTEVLHYYDNTNIFVISEDTGLVYFTPNYLQEGKYGIRIYVSDGEASDFKDFSLNLINFNDAPILQYIGPQTIHVNNSFNYTAYATDEEDGNTPGTLTFNSTFTSGATFFDISTVTGNINFTANASINGTYTARICVTDNGLSSPNANISFCNETAAQKNDCEDVQFIITAQNEAPNITSYYPAELNQTIYEGESVTFNASATDPEGATPAILWYKNNTFMLANSTYTFAASSGDAGKYNITAYASDGELNDSVTWNVRVSVRSVVVTPSAGVGGGGGGGGRACTELWLCTDWSMCQNASNAESISILGDLYSQLMINCSLAGISKGNCGFQTRSCSDKSGCSSARNKPIELQICTFTLTPNCYDGIINCHDGLCEVLPDCGGPCRQCTTCSDGIQNQGEEWTDCGGPCPPCPLEYPKPAKCGDKKCEISELFICRKDCGLFWLTTMILAVLSAALVIIVRREILISKTGESEKEFRKKRRHLFSLIALTRKAIDEKDLTLARHYYGQTRNFYNSLPSDEKKKFYSKIVRLFSDMGRLK